MHCFHSGKFLLILFSLLVIFSHFKVCKAFTEIQAESHARKTLVKSPQPLVRLFGSSENHQTLTLKCASVVRKNVHFLLIRKFK